MFSFKNKLDPNLKDALNDKLYTNYRVIIRCSTLLEKIERKIKSMRCEVIHTIPSMNCVCALLSPRTIERLVEYPEVRNISMDDYAFLCAKSIKISNKTKILKDLKLTGKNIGIGIIDTGIYPHADLIHPSNKIRNFIDLINNYKYAYDDNGHGTFISGMICGSGFSSKSKFNGIAVNSHIYSIKAFNKIGRAYVSNILFAIETIINESHDYNIRILCLPFETLNNNKTILTYFSTLFDKAIQNGITVIVPAGHNGCITNSITGIATLPNCLTVGGIDTTSKFEPYAYSSCGPCKKIQKPDITAGCVDITSLNTNTNFIPERNGMKLYASKLTEPYISYTGTSCAAAYVSGICALLLEKKPELTPKDIKSLLKLSCQLIDAPKVHQGWGVINLDRLFEK
jgi:subtilisin family serine protease